MRLAIFDYGAGNLHSLSKALGAPGIVVSVETDPRRLLSADVMVLPGVGAFGAAAARLASARADIAAALSDGMPCLGICLGMQLLFDASDESPGSPGLGVISGQVTRLRASRVPHMGWNRVAWNNVAGNAVSENAVSENAVSGNAVSGNAVSGNAVSENAVSENAVSGNAGSGNAVSGNAVSGNAVSGNAVTDHSRILVSEASHKSEPDVAYFAHSYACRPRDESVVKAWTVEGTDRFPSAVQWRNVVGVQFHPEKSSAPGLRFLQDFLGAV